MATRLATDRCLTLRAHAAHPPRARRRRVWYAIRVELPRWIPRRVDLLGLGLVAGVAGGAMALTRALPPSPLVSEVLLAMVLGALVRNSPLAGALRLGDAEDRFAAGIAFACQWLLRIAIVLMGLKVSTAVIGGSEIAFVVGACAVTVPSAFLVAHTVGGRTNLGRSLLDLLGAGSAICGASAVNATAPVAGASRQEQGLAVGVVFLSSVLAMLTFRALAHAVGLSPHAAGLWAGLAVNDLSSAVAVGAQMGEHGGVAAAAAKSTRILFLAPMLMVLALVRRSDSQPTSLRRSLTAALPTFIFGYLALAIARAIGDRWLGDAALWRTFLAGVKQLVDALLAMVSAGIGLTLALRSLLAQSPAAALVSIATSMYVAALTLALVLCHERQDALVTLAVGATALAATWLVHRLLRRR